MRSNQPIRMGRPVDGLLHQDSIHLATVLARNTGVTLTWEVLQGPITEVHGFGQEEEIVLALIDVLTMNVVSDPDD